MAHKILSSLRDSPDDKSEQDIWVNHSDILGDVWKEEERNTLVSLKFKGPISHLLHRVLSYLSLERDTINLEKNVSFTMRIKYFIPLWYYSFYFYISSGFREASCFFFKTEFRWGKNNDTIYFQMYSSFKLLKVPITCFYLHLANKTIQNITYPSSQFTLKLSNVFVFKGWILTSIERRISVKKYQLTKHEKISGHKFIKVLSIFET